METEYSETTNIMISLLCADIRNQIDNVMIISQP